MNETIATYRVLLQENCRMYKLNLQAKAGEQLEQIIFSHDRESTNDYAEIFRQCCLLVQAYSDEIQASQIM